MDYDIEDIDINEGNEGVDVTPNIQIVIVGSGSDGCRIIIRRV